MKRIVARNRNTGECKSFNNILDTICKCDGLTGEEKSLTLILATTEVFLDLKAWDIVLEAGEPDDLPDPDHSDILVNTQIDMQSFVNSLHRSEFESYTSDELDAFRKGVSCALVALGVDGSIVSDFRELFEHYYFHIDDLPF